MKAEDLEIYVLVWKSNYNGEEYTRQENIGAFLNLKDAEAMAEQINEHYEYLEINDFCTVDKLSVK